MQKNYYHASTPYCTKIYYTYLSKPSESTLFIGEHFGPFESFSEAKRNAYEYHRKLIDYARDAIFQLNSTRKDNIYEAN